MVQDAAQVGYCNIQFSALLSSVSSLQYDIVKPVAVAANLYYS